MLLLQLFIHSKNKHNSGVKHILTTKFFWKSIVDPALFDFEEESLRLPVQMSGKIYNSTSARPSSGTAYARGVSVNMAEGHVQQPATAGVMSSSPPFGPGGNISPLQRFVKAKGKINSIYEEIHTYVNDVTRFLNNLTTAETKTGPLKSSINRQHGPLSSIAEENTTTSVIEPDFLTKAESYGRQVDAIRQVLSRDHMKVVFFGRTSNGKSTLINAILGEKILPTGIGHTTSCFLQVEGGDEADPFLLTCSDEEGNQVCIFCDIYHVLVNLSTIILFHFRPPTPYKLSALNIFLCFSIYFSRRIATIIIVASMVMLDVEGAYSL